MFPNPGLMPLSGWSFTIFLFLFSVGALNFFVFYAPAGGGNSPDFIQIPCWAWI